MYQQYYETLQPHFMKKGCKIEIGMSDTDSLLFQVQNRNLEEIQEDLYELKEYFDFSNFPPNHPLYNLKNKNVPLHWKVEMKWIYDITHVVALKAKMYAYLYTLLKESFSKRNKAHKKNF